MIIAVTVAACNYKKYKQTDILSFFNCERKCLESLDSFQFMPSNSLPASPSTPSANSQSSQTSNLNAKPLSNLSVQAAAAIENVVQNLLKDSLEGSSGKRYYFFPAFTVCALTH